MKAQKTLESSLKVKLKSPDADKEKLKTMIEEIKHSIKQA